MALAQLVVLLEQLLLSRPLSCPSRITGANSQNSDMSLGVIETITD